MPIVDYPAASEGVTDSLLVTLTYSVRGKPHGWDPLVCLAEGSALLLFLHSTISALPSTLRYQSLFASPSTPIDTLKNWPMFKIRFAAREGQVTVHEMERAEAQIDVIEGKKAMRRVGFVLESWIEGVRTRSQARKEREPMI